MSEQAADRATALRRYLELASKSAGPPPDPWIDVAVTKERPDVAVIAGRRTVLVIRKSALAKVPRVRLAALVDGSSVVIERLAGEALQPPPSPKPRPNVPAVPPPDRLDRLLMVDASLTRDLKLKRVDATFWYSQEMFGAPLVLGIARGLIGRARYVVPNRRESHMGEGLYGALTAMVVESLGDEVVTAAVQVGVKRGLDRIDREWKPGCLPSAWFPTGEPLSALMREAFLAAGDGLETARAFLADEQRYFNSRAVASSHDKIVAALVEGLPEPSVQVLQNAGYVPVGYALDDAIARVSAGLRRFDAMKLWGDGARDPAKGKLRAAAADLHDGVVADQFHVDELRIQYRDEEKKARSAFKKMGLLTGFDYLAPIPDTQIRNSVSAASRLLPVAVTKIEGRRPLKEDEPVKVSLKWEEAEGTKNELLPRTPWDDKKGITWGGSSLAAVKLSKDLGSTIRVRPMRRSWEYPMALANGRPLDVWPDGSFLVPGTKGTQLALCRSGSLTCVLAWRGESVVTEDLKAVAAEDQPVLGLREWAARRVPMALPVIVDALKNLPDERLAIDMRLLAPYHGGDVAACDAMLERTKDSKPLLIEYLAMCRGNQDPEVLDRLVTLVGGESADANVQIAVQEVLRASLMREVTESGQALADLWTRGRKWLASATFVEAEDARDLYYESPGFKVQAVATGRGRACLVASGGWWKLGTGVLRVKIPSGSKPWLHVRYASLGQPVQLRGVVTNGKKTAPFEVKAPAWTDGRWRVESVQLKSPPKGDAWLVLFDPCNGYYLDAFALGPKPLD